MYPADCGKSRLTEIKTNAKESQEMGDIRITRQRAAIRAAHAKRKLKRLMPFDEWCAALNPTDAAKELYQFVRSSLERELADANGCIRRLSSRRTRRLSARHANPRSKRPPLKRESHFTSQAQ